MTNRLPPLSRDEWILLLHYFLTKPEPTHTDSHPDCQEFARLLGRPPGTVDSSLRNIKAYHDGGAGRAHGATMMRQVVDEFKSDSLVLATAALEALNRLGVTPAPSKFEAFRRLQDFNRRYRAISAAERKTMVTEFDRPTEARTDLISIVGTDCQVCGQEAFLTSAGRPYVEAHHIDELENRTPGNLCTANVLILCPNCHTKFHYASVSMQAVGDVIHLMLAGDQYTVTPNTEQRLRELLGNPGSPNAMGHPLS